MQKIVRMLLACVTVGLIAGASVLAAAPTSAPAIDLRTGWNFFFEGSAEGFVENVTLPTNSSTHILIIRETKAADPGEGRVGAVSSIHFPVDDDAWYDVTFSAVTEDASIGLVFSLENADGKVLARTTLPEIGGRGRRRGPATTATTATSNPMATPPALWKKYLVTLHARAADANVHMVITPIEPTNIWIDGLTLTPRSVAK